VNAHGARDGLPPRALAAVVAALALLAPGLAPGEALPASAGPASTAASRPHDAPAAAPGAKLPEPPPVYTTTEEGGFRFVYHPAARERALGLLGRAIAARAELSNQLGRDVLGAVEVRIADAPTQMAGLAPGPAPVDAGATSLAYGSAHLVVMSLTPSQAPDPPDLEDRLRHALAHLALDEALGGAAVPRWFHEGYAIHASGEDAAARAEILCGAALRDRLLGLDAVGAQFPAGPAEGSLAAAEAADFVRFLLDKQNREHFPALIGRLRNGEPFEQALGAAYGESPGRLEKHWRRAMARRYAFLPVLGGALLLWVAIAVGVLVRRLRRRKSLAARRARAAELARRPAPAPARRPAKPAEADDVIEGPIPPDPEVPKVEHDGRWYTLH
jgi:hypothetical protein